MPQEQSNVRQRQHTDLRKPRYYKVTIFNDDFTTMDFVVKVLTDVFYKNRIEAETLMLKVHREGQAVVGIYTYDLATTKAKKAMTMARQAGFPLRLEVEPE